MKIKQIFQEIIDDPEIALEGIDISLLEDLSNTLNFYLRDYDYRQMEDKDLENYFSDLDHDL